MDASSFLVGILFAIVILPLLTIFLVSLRRVILDGGKISELSKKYILVTGCDSGFGFLLSQRLDSLGCHVIAACLTEDGKKRLKEMCSSRLHAISMDVTCVDSVKSAENYVKEILPSPDALWGVVNNAGIMTFSIGFEFDTIESFKQVSDVSLWGTVIVTKTFAPYLKKSKGRIVNVGSMLSRLCTPSSSAYCIAKSGVVAFSDSVRAELIPWGVSVHILEPGAFKTNLLDKERVCNQLKSFWDKAPAEMKEDYGEQWLEKYKQEMIKNLDLANPNRNLVVDCMEHALLSTRPKKRYFPGYDSAFGVWWVALLPADITDMIWSKIARANPPAKAML